MSPAADSPDKTAAAEDQPPEDRRKSAPRSSKKKATSREERLADALRANLRRRKAGDAGEKKNRED